MSITNLQGYGNVYIKQDAKGFIVDPVNVKLKAGWGDTKSKAIEHFMMRNPIDEATTQVS